MNTELLQNVWAVGIIGAVIGFILAYIVIKMTNGNVRKQLKTESELKQVKTEVEQQKVKIEEHFAESADLLKSLAQDYQRLYKHLAKSSADLLPEDTAKGMFDAGALLERSQTETALEVLVDDEGIEEKAPPKDYSKGASGLLKAKDA
ncbi:hypothetical protein A1D23_05180 [Chelonobacter oris]|uniref:Z-ring associated protein G n=1 Tax=Chelonobacter oris TaxID=505317 RepID=A0A0A3ANT8_9PAST|nr:DUF1043 family protein [Chelonobacter oris]KGQ71073.1 hypothetical protein OA57_02240 [Chelonobacter oris]MDH2999487.1 hypothetical protein [Chelonobacter oris]